MDNAENMGGQVSPEEAMRQLIQLRMQLGPERFATVAGQMGMPQELIDHIEQLCEVEVGGAGGRRAEPAGWWTPAAAPSAAPPAGWWTPAAAPSAAPRPASTA